MGFAQDFQKLIDKAGDQVDQVVRASVAGLGAAIVQKSPVDTGRFKGNWQYGGGSINSTTTSPLDPTGASANARILAGLATWKPGQTMYITNSLPYAKRLEYDAWSKQAPAGMVRLSVQAFKDNVAKAARDTK